MFRSCWHRVPRLLWCHIGFSVIECVFILFSSYVFFQWMQVESLPLWVGIGPRFSSGRCKQVQNSDGSPQPLGGGGRTRTLTDSGWAGLQGWVPSVQSPPPPREATSRELEGKPEKGPCLPPPMGGGVTRTLVVSVCLHTSIGTQCTVHMLKYVHRSIFFQ